MPLPPAVSRIPVSIEDISVVLVKYIADQAPLDDDGVPIPPPIFHKANYEVQVKYSNDEIRVMNGDLVPHLTAAQKTALIDFMEDMFTKAETEILP